MPSMPPLKPATVAPSEPFALANPDKPPGPEDRIMTKKDPDHPLVYSSEFGRVCPACQSPEKNCICKKSKPSPPGDEIVRVSRETKGRKGKGVTLVTGLPHAAITTLAKELKQRCGSGGTVKDGTIEIQGDHRESILSCLTEKGYRVKKAGG